LIPKDGSKTLIVKGAVSAVSVSGPNTRSGDLLIAAWDADAAGLANGNYGVSGGTNVSPSSTSDVTPTGVRLMKGYPTFTKVPLTGGDLTIQNGSGRKLYRFKVSTTGGEVAFYKFSFNVASSSKRATTSLFSLYAFTDEGFSQADTSFSSNGLINAGQCFNGSNDTAAGANGPGKQGTPGAVVPTVEIYPDRTSCNTATTTYQFTGTRYFQLEATIASTETGSGTESFEVSLLGDAAFPTVGTTLMKKAGYVNSTTVNLAQGRNTGNSASVDRDTNDDLIWSPRSTSSIASMDDLDWTNGYQVLGLPTTNMATEIFTSTN
jgi:hypothetical protein